MLIRASPETTGSRWAVPAVVLATAVLDLFDGTITNLAAPTIAADLGGGRAQAVTRSLLVVIAATLTRCGLVWLLPRRPQNHR